MSWYWIVVLSLAWIASLHIYAHAISGNEPYSEVDPLLDGVLFFTYLALWASWPAVVLVQGLIDTTWYVWVLLAIEVVCLFFTPIISALRREETKPAPVLSGSLLDKATSLFVVGMLMVIAPLIIALKIIGHYASNPVATNP
jgi:hypothetical protein